MQHLKFSEVFGGLRERFRTVPDECESLLCAKDPGKVGSLQCKVATRSFSW